MLTRRVVTTFNLLSQLGKASSEGMVRRVDKRFWKHRIRPALHLTNRLRKLKSVASGSQFCILIADNFRG